MYKSCCSDVNGDKDRSNCGRPVSLPVCICTHEVLMRAWFSEAAHLLSIMNPKGLDYSAHRWGNTPTLRWYRLNPAPAVDIYLPYLLGRSKIAPSRISESNFTLFETNPLTVKWVKSHVFWFSQLWFSLLWHNKSIWIEINQPCWNQNSSSAVGGWECRMLKGVCVACSAHQLLQTPFVDGHVLATLMRHFLTLCMNKQKQNDALHLESLQSCGHPLVHTNALSLVYD